MLKERWFNYRPLCLVFLFLLLGSLFAFYIGEHLVVTLILSTICLIALLIISIIKKNYKLIIIPIASLLLGFSAYNLAIINFNKGIDYIPSIIDARICSVGKANDNYLYLEADSVSFDGSKIKDNIIIYLYDTDSLYKDIEIGRKVSFQPSLFYHSDIFKYEIPNANLVFSKNKYVASTNIKQLQTKEVDTTFAEKVKLKVKENLSLGLTNENVEIAYSSLFGEKELLNDNQYSAYKLSGVAHLLAVSGLHVSIIVGIFNFIFKKIKYNKWHKFIVVGLFLALYTYICNFSYSIIRASVMSLLLILSDVFGTEYDSFCSISIAGIIIYILNPLCVFDVSFLMSFTCVVGITMLHKPIRLFLEKCKVNTNISNAMALSISSSISLIFIMAFFFQTLNIISILSNIILIPIFTIAFIYIYIASIIGLFLPFLTQLIGYITTPFNYIFEFVNLAATILGNLKISNFYTLQFNYIAILIYFVLLLIMGRFCTAKYQYKALVILPLVALLFCCLV